MRIRRHVSGGISLAIFLMAGPAFALMNAWRVDDTNDPAYRSTANLSQSGKVWCSGVLVAYDTELNQGAFLTAAHCMKDSVTGVRFGKKFTEATELKVVERRIHSTYDFQTIFRENAPEWDIAIGRFEGVLPQGFEPAAIEMKNKSIAFNQSGIHVSGYGFSSFWHQKGVLFKNHASITEQKATWYTANFPNNDQSVQLFDSGGPIFLWSSGGHMSLLGIMGFGLLNENRESTRGFGGVWVLDSHIFDFIDSWTRQWKLKLRETL